MLIRSNITRDAFSLVELSIVLVILGLLTGGILTGQSLIRVAELRSVVSEFQRYQTAAGTFRDQYFAIPGDMTNATAFWGSMTNCGVASPSGSGTQTCNGNGNGVLEGAIVSRTGESMTFWQHLANAGLIEGTYTGISGAGGDNHAIIGVNVPASKMTNAGWSTNYIGPGFAGNASFYADSTGNQLRFGQQISTGNTHGPVLKPEEAWNVDTKVDDGKPARGLIHAVYWNNLCASADDGSSTANDPAASYRLTDTTAQCALILRNIF
ncbi:MAG: hypothetical protein CMM93_01345 [Rickettsiales bacterium]|nr:hypothetical protein [Rickettsiales bacterium]|tara:strand:- start:387 stop:1187 length:801 start_codon:yes stop_codon:yes gene_type:complete